MSFKLIDIWSPETRKSVIPIISGNDDAIWTVATPCRVDDGRGGSLILLENIIVCPACGAIARQRMLYAWGETSDEYREMKDDQGRIYHTIEDGESIKHLATECLCGCGHNCYS